MHDLRIKKWVSLVKYSQLIMVSLLVSACSTMPDILQSDVPLSLSVQSVEQNSANYQGQTVRWGGVITQVINNENDTWVEVLALELHQSGRPQNSRLQNQGRFIAKIDQFLDPEVYQKGNSFTVVGEVNQKIDGKIGKFNYSFPVVKVKGHYLWPTYDYDRFNRGYYNSITAGYWYYPFHVGWSNGYRYYGYGIRRMSGYCPYYPLYGHLNRRLTVISDNHRSGVYTPTSRFWHLSRDIQTAFNNSRNNSQRQHRSARNNRAISIAGQRRPSVTRNSSRSTQTRQAPRRIKRVKSTSQPN